VEEVVVAEAVVAVVAVEAVEAVALRQLLPHPLGVEEPMAA
jgi:hypothetical protein